MDSIKERISSFIDYLGLNNTQFERSCGLGRGVISSNKVHLRSDTIALILKAYPNLSAYWLLLGKGDMLKNEDKKGEKPQNINALIEYLRNDIKEKEMKIAELYTTIGSLQNTIERTKELLNIKLVENNSNHIPKK